VGRAAFLVQAGDRSSPRLCLCQTTKLDAYTKFANATRQGLSMDELTPLDPKASAELAALLSNVLSFSYTRIAASGHYQGRESLPAGSVAPRRRSPSPLRPL
jgi:hypothetical protein